MGSGKSMVLERNDLSNCRAAVWNAASALVAWPTTYSLAWVRHRFPPALPKAPIDRYLRRPDKVSRIFHTDAYGQGRRLVIGSATMD